MAPEMSERERWAAFSVCLCAAALAVLDISKVNVAVPAIQESLGAGPTEVQLIVAGYVLAFGVALIPFGRAGDLRSRRAMFLVGLVLFGVASLACAFSPTAELLVLGRLLEGVAAGAMMPQALGLIQQLFTGPERGKAFGLYGAMIGLTLAIAPPLGGFLVGLGGPDWGWRLVFLMNVPLMLALLVLALRLLPNSQPKREGPRNLDPVGVMLLAATTLALMSPFVLTTGSQDDSPFRWLLLAVAAILGMAFVLWERWYRSLGRAPVIDVVLFQNRGFRNGVVIALAYYAGSPAAMLLTTLFLQLGLGASAPVAGLAIIPFAVAYIASAWWSGRATNRWGRALVLVGLVLVIVGWLLAAMVAVLAPAEVGLWLLPITLVVPGLGAGAVSAPNQTLTLADVPPGSGGLAGSISQVAQRIGAAVGIAAVVSIFYGTIADESGLSGELLAYQHGYRNAMFATLGLYVLALVFAIMDQRWRRSIRRGSKAQ